MKRSAEVLALGAAAALTVAACGGRVNGGGTPDEGDKGAAPSVGGEGDAGPGSQSRGGRDSKGAGGSGGNRRNGEMGRRDPASGGRDVEAGGTASGGNTAVASSGGASVSPVDAGQSSQITEVWVGQIAHPITFSEYFRSVTKPQHVVMVLAGSIGSIVFGEDPPPPKATDPDVFYPPLKPEDYPDWQSIDGFPLNGFPYTLLDLRVEDGRLTASISMDELWLDWCALQPKTYEWPYDGGGYLCSPSSADVDDHAGVTIESLAKADLCNFGWPENNICRCDQSACRANMEIHRCQLDLAFTNNLYEGQVWSSSGAGAGASGVWLDGVRLSRVK